MLRVCNELKIVETLFFNMYNLSAILCKVCLGFLARKDRRATMFLVLRCVTGLPLHMPFSNNFQPSLYHVYHIRGWSDKYLASPPDGVTIARRVYYRVELLVDD